MGVLAISGWFTSHTPIVCMAVCLTGVLGIILMRKRPNIREGISLLTAGLNFALVVWMYQRFQSGETIQATLLELMPGITLSFKVDALGLLFALVASGLWILNTLYSIGYMRAHHEPKQTRFYCCFAIAIAAVMGAAFSANLFSMFAFYEMLTICTYPLVIHSETDVARAGAKRYVSYLLGTSLAFLLPALFLVWHMAGSLDFMPDGLLQGSQAGAGWLGLTFLLAIFGLAKCGMMPFHSWLPAAMVAPTPVSALLHAVAVVKMGVFGVCRVVFHVFGTDLLADIGIADVLVVMACFTIVCGSLVALVQDNLKRRLAYSTISQLSYILLGIALLAPQAGIGGVAHIAVHAWSKITLFFAAGAIYVAAHKTKVSELDGIGRKMPFTMAAFTIGALSMIGVPPTAGIVSKWYLVQGSATNVNYAVMAVLFTSTILNAAYFLPIIWRAFFRPAPPDDPHDDHDHAHGEEHGSSGITWFGMREAPWPCVLALSLTALGTLLWFMCPEWFVGLAEQVVAGGGS